MVEIGLTYQPKFGGAMASPAPPGTTGLEVGMWCDPYIVAKIFYSKMSTGDKRVGKIRSTYFVNDHLNIRKPCLNIPTNLAVLRTYSQVRSGN